MKHLSFIIVAYASTTVTAIRFLKDYEINLDLSPEDRYNDLIVDFNDTVWQYYNENIKDKTALTDVLYKLAAKRGPENAEQQGEIEGLARLSKLPLPFVQSIQMLYELQTIMIPVVNFTDAEAAFEFLPEEYKPLATLPWRGPGCTGILAMNKNDGTVYHARNLDFSPVDIMTKLVYNGIFTKNGVEIFRSQMIAGYTMAITGTAGGQIDGYAIERNTRYTDHTKGFDEMIHNLIDGRLLNGWTVRKILENEVDYESAINALKTQPYASAEYAIVSGVKKGTILSRNPDNVAHVQELGSKNFDERDDYIIMTNFDFFWHDAREYLDPTGGQLLHPRRIAAQKLLNATEEGSLDGEKLFEIINAPGVLADTVFQAIINVEQGMWNVSMPDIVEN